MKTLRIILCSFALLAVIWNGNTEAQIIKPEAVSGTTYTCYLISRLDIINFDLIFDEKGMMQLTAYPGNSFYAPILNSFTGAYWTLNQQIGLNAKGDYLFIMIGSTSDPYMSGICIIIYEYKKIYLSLFFGFRATEAGSVTGDR